MHYEVYRRFTWTKKFPFLSGDETPMEQKGYKLNIPNISTYIAIHSFASVLKRNGANIACVSLRPTESGNFSYCIKKISD
jgi:hypothetical protein